MTLVASYIPLADASLIVTSGLGLGRKEPFFSVPRKKRADANTRRDLFLP